MISLFSWLLIPVTAYASLSPAPVTSNSQVTPVLQENMAYEQQVIPIDQENALYASVEPQATSTDEIVTLLQQYFPQNWQKMYQIAQKESNLDPKAYNPESHDTCSGSYGILQVACVNYSGDPQDLFDIETNIKTARKVYDSQSYGAWGVCTKKLVDCD